MINKEPVANREHTGQQINLIDLLALIVRKSKLIIGVTIVATVTTAVFTLFVPNVYTARTMILPADDDGGGMMGAMMAQMGGLANLAGGLVGNSTTKADLYTSMLKSETVKDPIIDKFKLLDTYHARMRSGVYARLDSVVLITTGKKDGIITIAVDSEDPKLAAALANAYVDELGRMVARLNMTDAGENSSFLEKRITEARADLVRAEEALKQFQVKNKAISVTDQAKASIEGIAQLRGDLAAKEVQLAALKSQLTDSSQEVKAAKATIGNLRSQIAKLEGTGSSSSLPSIGAMPEIGQQYLRLMRDFKIQESVLEMLSKQYEVSKLTELKDVSSFKVIQKAKVPEVKSKPRRGFIVVLTSVTVFLLMILFVFVQYLFNSQNEEDIRRWRELVGNLRLRKEC